jgi:hypothetical protein
VSAPFLRRRLVVLGSMWELTWARRSLAVSDDVDASLLDDWSSPAMLLEQRVLSAQLKGSLNEAAVRSILTSQLSQRHRAGNRSDGWGRRWDAEAFRAFPA